MACTNQWRSRFLYLLPNEAIVESFPIVLSVYATFLTHLESKAAIETVAELNANMSAMDSVNHSNESKKSMPSSVVWKCHFTEIGQSYFKTWFQVAFVLALFLYILVFLFYFCRPEFWSKRFSLKLKKFIGDLFLLFSILSLLSSYNISPMLCQYDPILKLTDKNLTFEHHPLIRMFHKIAPTISMAFFFCWLISNIIFCACECKKFGWNEMFYDNEIDSDAEAATDDEFTHYEISYVRVRCTAVTVTESGRNDESD